MHRVCTVKTQSQSQWMCGAGVAVGEAMEDDSLDAFSIEFTPTPSAGPVVVDNMRGGAAPAGLGSTGSNFFDVHDDQQGLSTAQSGATADEAPPWWNAAAATPGQLSSGGGGAPPPPPPPKLFFCEKNSILTDNGRPTPMSWWQ